MTDTVAWFLMPALREGDLESPFYRAHALGMAYTLLCEGLNGEGPSNYFRKQMKSCNKRPLGSRPLKQICFPP